MKMEETSETEINSIFKELSLKNKQILKNPKILHEERYLEIKIFGNNYSLMVQADSFENYKNNFNKMYCKEFGFISENRSLVIESVRLRSTHVLEKTSNSNKGIMLIIDIIVADKSNTMSNVWFEIDGKLKEIETPHYKINEIKPNTILDGPCVVLVDTSTILVEPDFSIFFDKDYNLILQKYSQKNNKIIKNEILTEHPIELSLISNKFMNIAEEMGYKLQKTAVSTNIKERLDFSCAIFDHQGRLVANAPHLPVHLGSMQEAVKFQIHELGDNWLEGESILSNHPMAGGTHLPDITIITPFFLPQDNTSDQFIQVQSEKINTNRPIFYVASKGHHADIGGISPGSMPSFSTTLVQEGFQTKSMKIVRTSI